MSIQDLINIIYLLQGIMRRGCTPVCDLFSLKYYECNNVITFLSRVISLHLYQPSPRHRLKHIELIRKALIIEPDKHLLFSLNSHKQKLCEIYVTLKQACFAQQYLHQTIHYLVRIQGSDRITT